MYQKLRCHSEVHVGPVGSGVIEKTSDDLLAVHDMPTRPLQKMSLWLLAGPIVLIALIALTSLNVPAALMLVFVLLASVGLLLRGKATEIDLAVRKIRMTWKAGFFVWRRTYSLDEYTTVKIEVRDRMVEGYRLPVFSVVFVGSHGHITLFSTDNHEEARAVLGEITGFLENKDMSTQVHE